MISEILTVGLIGLFLVAFGGGIIFAIVSDRRRGKRIDALWGSPMMESLSEIAFERITFWFIFFIGSAIGLLGLSLLANAVHMIIFGSQF